MGKYIFLPSHTIDNNSIYLNGRVLNPETPLTLNVKKLTNEKYNIDFILEFGDNAKYNGATINVEGASYVVTNLNGSYGKDKKVGKNKLLQVVKIGNIDNFTIKITPKGGKVHTVNVTLVEKNDKNILLPDLKTIDNVKLYPTASADYPVSNFDMPMPILYNQYYISWFSNKEQYLLGNDGNTVSLFYNKELFSIDNIDINQDDQNTGNVNNLNLGINYEISDLNNTNITNFKDVVVFEFKDNDGLILSSRSITFVRMNLKLADEFNKTLDRLYLPGSTDLVTEKDFSYKSIYPDTNILDTEYIQWFNNNGNTGISRLAKSMVDLFNIDEENDNIKFNLVKDPDFSGYNVNVLYKNPNDSLMLGLRLKNVTISNTWQNITLEKDIDYSTLEIKDTELTINKPDTTKINVKGRNIAKIEVALSEPGNSGLDISVDNVLIYNVELPHNGKKVYPDFEANINIDASNGVPGDYRYLVKGLDSDGKELITENILINVHRPIPNITSDYKMTKINIQQNKSKKISVNCENVYKATVINTDNPECDVVIENIKHKGKLTESGVYPTYTFDLKLTGIQTGNIAFTLRLSDDRDEIFKDYKVAVDIYSTEYTPTRPNSIYKNIPQGLDINFSYTKRLDYNVPAAFIDNNQEADYILVSKYPIPQTDDIVNNYSKPFRHRLEYIKENKVQESSGPEGGSLFKIINKDIPKNIAKKLKEGNVLNNKTIPVVNSIYLDTMLSNLTDLNYFAYLNSLDKDTSWFNRTRSNDNKNKYKDTYVPYPETPLLDYSNTKGGTWKIGSTNSDYIIYRGVYNKSLEDEIDYRDNILLPNITGDSLLTHNGQKCGIVDPYGVGVKVYYDVNIEYKNSKYVLNMLDPYTTSQNSNNEQTLRPINFDKDLFLENTVKSFIGVNDFPLNTKSKLFSGVSYCLNNDLHLMDNAGIPFNNMILDYEEDDSFKGNKGFRSDYNTTRFSKSMWCNDLSKIKDGVKGYYVSGLTYDKSLVKSSEESSDNNHIGKIYPGYVDDTIEGTYRSRLLLADNALYHINKNDGHTNDQIHFHNRVHFLVFEDYKNPVPYTISSKWLILEKDQPVPFKIETKGNITFDKDEDISIDLTENTITGRKIKQGKIRFTITLNGYDDTFVDLEYKVIEDLPDTMLNISTTKIVGYMGTEYPIEVESEASIDISADDPTLYKLIPISIRNINKNYNLLVRGEGSTTIRFSSKAVNKNKTVKELHLVCYIPVNTTYNLSSDTVELTREEAINNYNENNIFKKIKLLNTNIKDGSSLFIWSNDFNGKRCVINNDFTFSVDLGELEPGDYTINYIAQVNAEFNLGSSLTNAKPKLDANNKNKPIEGVLNIKIK